MDVNDRFGVRDPAKCGRLEINSANGCQPFQLVNKFTSRPPVNEFRNFQNSARRERVHNLRCSSDGHGVQNTTFGSQIALSLENAAFDYRVVAHNGHLIPRIF
jgi:hypothetical protein